MEFVASPPASRERGWYWPLLIVALLVGQMSIVLTGVWIASSDKSVAVEPNYYEKAVKWDDQARQAQRNQELGWGVAIRVSDRFDGLHERHLVCELKDRDGNAVTGANLEIEAFANVRSAERVKGTLRPNDASEYEGELPIIRDGLWEMRIRATRGDDVFTAVKSVAVPRALGDVR